MSALEGTASSSLKRTARDRALGCGSNHSVTRSRAGAHSTKPPIALHANFSRSTCMSTTDPDPIKATRDPAAEGARARHQGKPRDACSYPLGSQEREEWMEGYDGRVEGAGPDLPMEPT